MIFLTVGTYPIQFDRLIKAVDHAVMQGLIKETVFAQTGSCNYKPQSMESVEMLSKDDFDSHMKNATGLISHAGIGTITLALENNKPLLVMPRMRQHREHVNDHQVSTARKYEELGHVLAAYSPSEIAGQAGRLNSFVPKMKTPDPQAVSERISKFLNELQANNN